MRRTLDEFLAGERDRGAISPGLAALLCQMAEACARISRIVAMGAIADSLGAAGSQNVQQEEQKQLDLITNEILLGAFADSAVVAGVASEEMETFVPSTVAPGRDAFLVLFDPLDGSSNIDVNASVGTIFSVLPSPAAGRRLTEPDFLQRGENQVAAGYAIYGPQSTLVLTVRSGAIGFTLNPQDGRWLLTHEHIRIPHQTAEFAVNMSNMRHWAAPVRAYVEACLAGKSGPRAKDFNMRWVASMVADVHRVLVRGGVFLYPWDQRDPGRPGKLRLMYEANPMALIVEQAGGKATDGRQPILDVVPNALHERVAVMLGSLEEVDEILAHHDRHATAAMPTS
jgi:fructose-1,6-bisphosphatase I